MHGELCPICSARDTLSCTLSPTSVPQDVESKFSKYGRVKEVRIVRNPATGESRGFGFVGMSEESEVDAVRRPLVPSVVASSLRPVACQTGVRY